MGSSSLLYNHSCFQIFFKFVCSFVFTLSGVVRFRSEGLLIRPLTCDGMICPEGRNNLSVVVFLGAHCRSCSVIIEVGRDSNAKIV